MSESAVSEFSSVPSSFLEFRAANEVLMEFRQDGTVAWKGRVVEGDDEFRAAVVALIDVMNPDAKALAARCLAAEAERDEYRLCASVEAKAGDEARAEVAALREVVTRFADAAERSPVVQTCRTQHYQQCHICPQLTCGDNMTAALTPDSGSKEKP